jgi:hypothetical protein
VLAWVQALGGPSHAAAGPALAHLVHAVLVSQSLRPSALMRALLSPTAVPARQRYRRVARAWTRPWLTAAWLTPRLVRAALALVPGGRYWLALDSVRGGGWEVFTVGLVWHGRVLPVGWAVLPYPWPKGQFTPTVCALLEQVAAAWPATATPPHLLADRAFPSRAVFGTLRRLGWGWTVRLRASVTLQLAGQPVRLRERIAQSVPERWAASPAQYGVGRDGVAATLVIGRGVPVLPCHQRGPASLQARQQQAQRRDHDLASKHRRATRREAPPSDRWLVLFTTHAHWQPAVTAYRRRWATEGTYRDGQGGWDGRHGWDLERTLAQATSAAQVAAIVGLWALGTLLQSWLGDQVGAPPAPAAVQAVVRQWTTSGRLSVWARGQFALREPSGALGTWLRDTLAAGAARVAAAPPLARATPPRATIVLKQAA